MSVQINVQASQSALAQSIAQGVAAFNSRYAGQNQLNLQINARNFSQPLGRITSDLADFESALKASNARVLAFGASTAVLGGVVRSFKEIANVTLEVEKSLTDINRVLNLSTSGLQKFSSELFNVSKQTASSFDDASKAALEFSRQGLSTEETLKRTADALTLVRLTGISSTKAVEDLTATINGFSKAGLTTSQVVNKLAAVEQDFAVSASDLTEALSRTGQAAQEAGVSFDELNALVTTAQQNTARGGAVIGNALKTIFTRLQRTETLDQLQNFNIAVRDIEGNILPAVQILKNFADRYNDLADAQRAQLSEQVAGVYQVNILKGVIKDLNNNQGTYVQALQRGAMAANEAEIANQRLNKTLSALVTQTGVGLQQLANNVGKVTFAPIFEAIVSPVNDAVSYINDTLEGEGIGSVFANGLLKGVRNVIAGPGLAVAFAVIAKVAKNTFEDATKALPAILGLTTEAQKRANIEKSIISILQTQSNLSLALQGQQGNLSTQAATVLNYARLQTAQYQQQLQVAQQLAPLLAAQNVTVGTRGIQVGPRIKAGGHIPAFAEMSERMGAAMGGYKSGKVVKAPKSVGANTYMNSAEEVKYVSGFNQPFINPPANSKAGRAHRQNSISRTGVDPYMANGFIPNFAQEKFITEKLNVKDGDTISAYPVEPLSRDYRLANVDTPEYGQFGYEEAKKLLEYRYSGDKGVNLLNSNIVKGSKAAFYRGVFNDQAISKLLVQRGLAVPDFRYTRDNELISLANNAMAEKIGIFKYRNHPKVIQFKVQQDLMRENIKEKDFKHTSKLGETVLRRKADEDMLRIKSNQPFEGYSQGFIPNFAPPTSAIRVPWFKKFGNASFDAIQPTLGISKASDIDTFRQINFRSNAKGADKVGDSNIFAPLYEDFVFKALQLTSQSKIKDQLIRGYVNQPGTDQKQSAYDAFLEDVAFEEKGFPKGNLTGSISKNLNDKFERYAKANPAGAAKIKEAIMIFNEVGHENQITSDFGKNFTQLAGTSYSQMLKNSPDLVKELSAETNMLLNRYVKNPAFLAMSAAKGFIPNFGNLDVGARSMLVNSGITPFVVDLQRKTMAASSAGDDMFHSQIVNKKFVDPITGKPIYPKLYGDDIHSAAWKDIFVRGFVDSGTGKVSFDLTEPQKKDKNFMQKNSALLEIVKKKYAEKFKSAIPMKPKRVSPLAAFRSGGFIPNFASGTDIYKGYAFNNTGKIYNDLYHSDAWDSIEGSTAGAIKYAYHNNKLLLQTNKAISPILKKAFLSRGVPESAFSPVEDVDSMMRSKNKQEINDKLKNLGSVQLSSGIQAILEKGYYRKLIKGQQSYNIPGGVSPEELKIFGGVDGWIKWQEKNYEPLKWDSHASGFIPNFASRREMFRDLVKFNLESAPDNQNVLGGKTTLFRGVRNNKNPIFGQSRKHSQTENDRDYFRDTDINKIANDHVLEKKLLPFVSASTDKDIAEYFARGRRDDNLLGSGVVGSKTIKNSRIFSEQSIRKFTDKYGEKALKDIMLELSNWGSFGYGKGMAVNFQSFSQKKGFEGTDFAKEISFLSNGFIPNLANFIDVDTLSKNSVTYSGDLMKFIKDIEASIGRNLSSGELRFLTHPKTNLSKLNDPKVLNRFINSERKGGFAGFANGFVPNFNFIKGRNSFQKNWLIETAKKRNLNLNDPNTFTKLAAEFAKTYPNDQGMFGLSKGFIPNFAYKQSVMSLEESMSGNKAIFDAKPFPHIRNSSQPTFSSAISDHGGLSNALSDSMRGQKNAGLMSKGFVPNFATVRSQDVFGGVSSRALLNTERTLFVEMNIALRRLTQDLTLTAQQQQILQNTVQQNAQALQQATGSSRIVAAANNALVTSIQQNQNAQAAAAQATRAAAGPSTPRAAQQTLSTRIGGLLGGARGAVRGRRFDRMLGGLSNNVGFTLAAPMVGGFLESAIGQGKDRSEMGYGQRLASTGVSAALTGLSTGAAIGSAIPGIGTAAGAAIGAIVGFSGAALNARTSLDDLSKSINNVINENKKDIDAAKTIGQLEKQIAGETDPFAIAVLRMKIQEAADSISNAEFAKNLLSSSKSVEEFNKTINEFTLSSGPLNQLGSLPSLIQSFAKKTKTRETSSGFDAFLNFNEQNSIFFAEQFEKNKTKAVALAGTFFDPIAIAFTNIQDEIEKTSPQAAKDFGDILNNILGLKKSGALKNRLNNLVDTNAIPKELADKFSEFINETDNEYFDQYLGNLSVRLPIIRDNVKKRAVAQTNRIADADSLKKMFAKINNEIQNALNEATLQLMNIEFKSNIGKLNIEKIGGIFDTAASAIGKNLESIAKAQFDALMVQVQLSREAQLADLNRTQFQETGTQERNKYLAERQSRVSAFFEKNLAPGEDSRKAAVQALGKIGSDLTYDFKNLESLAYNMGVDVENARKELIRNEEYQKKSFLTQRSNAETLFDLEQSYAKDLRDLKKKTSEEDLKLEEVKYANLLREKQIIQSFDFANQTRQIQTQAEISRMGLGMEVNPNFFAGASRFQQEDYKFKLDREKEDKRIAAEIRTATEQQRIVDIQRQVMSANTDATNKNTEAIRESTIAFLNQQLSKVESGLSESKNASKKIEKIVTKMPDEKAPLDRKKTFADPENYVEKSFRFFNQAPQNNLIPGTNIDRRAGVNNYNYQDSTPQTPASEDKSPSLFEKSLDRFINFLNSTYLPKSRDLSEGPIYSKEQSFIQSEDTSIPQYKGGDFLNFLNEGNRYVDAKQMSNAVTTAENREIEVQRELTAETQKQLELENQRKNINQELQSIIKQRTSTVQSTVSRVSPDLSRVGIAKEELKRLSGQLKLNESNLTNLQTERNQTLESNRQVQLDQQIFDLQEKINKGKLDQLNYTEQIKTIEERIKENNEYLASRGQFSTGVKKAVGTIREETEMFKETLGTTTVNAFRDGLVGAMDAALNKADDLESALMGVAAGFLREIQGAMLRNIANQAISSFMPSFNSPATGNQRGGIIRAQKGMYISGGRTGDKNPALLEDGEYVLNRNAVKALGGPRAIDSLNFNAFPRFATGGDPGTMSASVSMNEPFERLSMYGREQSPEFQNYVERLREEEAAREKKRAERKALLNQFIGTLISTGVSMGISSAVSAAKNSSMANANLKGATGSMSNGTTTQVTNFADAKSLIDSGGSVTLANGSVLTKSNFADGFSRSTFNEVAATRFAESGIKINSGSLFRKSSATLMGKDYANQSIKQSFANPAAAFNRSQSIYEFTPYKGKQQGGAIGFNQGGFLPYGSRLTDSIPAYLTGGEYVVNSRAVRKYGVGGLNRINSGVARFQDGGMVNAETGSPSNTSNTANNNVSINITVNASGGKVGDQESDSNSEGTEGNAKELSNRIKAVVLDVITSEQRTGGLLDSTKKR